MAGSCILVLVDLAHTETSPALLHLLGPSPLSPPIPSIGPFSSTSHASSALLPIPTVSTYPHYWSFHVHITCVLSPSPSLPLEFLSLHLMGSLIVCEETQVVLDQQKCGSLLSQHDHKYPKSREKKGRACGY